MPDHPSELLQRARARVGTVLKEKWTIDALIGVGGMAVVYAATHRNKKRVAIKMLHPELSIDPGVKARFLREGYVANTIDHPGGVKVDDDDIAEDGAAFLVMELLDGETVHARADRKGGVLPAVEVLSIADQLLSVLEAAHAKGIVHRDLKPENLFLDRSGQLKVLDFGIARLRETTDASGTRTGSLLGTPAFMAPEQARGRWDDVDTRTDLWAVGATMFSLLTGRVVHEAETANESLALAITQRAPAIASVNPDVPGPIAAVVDRALAYEKDARYPDAASMQLAIRDAYAVLDEAAPSDRAPALSLPDASDPHAGADFSATPLVPDVPMLMSDVAPALSPNLTTARGLTRSDAGVPPAHKLPVVPVAIGGAVAFVLIAVVATIAISRSGPSSSVAATAPASAPAQPEASASAPAAVATPTATATTIVTPAAESPPAAESSEAQNGDKKKKHGTGATGTQPPSPQNPANASPPAPTAETAPAAPPKPAAVQNSDPFARRR